MACNKSDLEIYCLSVLNGEILACSKVKQQCERMLKGIENKSGEFHFDISLAEKPCKFIESFCKIPSGKIGKPMLLELFQKAWIQSIFGFVDDEGLRQFREALIVEGRKNAKTTTSAAIELYMLVADKEGSPQIYNVATSGDQASLGYSATKKMVLQSGLLAKYIKPIEGGLSCRLNMGTIKPLNARPATLDGLDVHLAVMDELAAMKDRELYDVMIQAMASREQPLMLEITTNGFVRDAIFDAQYDYAKGVLDGTIKDKRFLPWIYELDERNEWDKEECWIKANPGLGTIKKFETLQRNVQKAKDDPTFKATVMTKDFNMPMNTSMAWLSFEEAVNEEPFELKRGMFRYGIFGFDASDTVDLTSASLLLMREGDDHIYEKNMYWIPEDAIRNAAGKERDGVPYEAWIARGLMRTVPGNKIDKRVLLDWMEEIKDEYDVFPFCVGFDPWHMDDSTLRDLEMFVGANNVHKVRQGAATLSQPMKQLKADYAANRIIDNHNPMNEWCRMNVAIRTDINCNIQPDKKKNDPRNRIDGFMAELDAYIVLMNRYDEYLQTC